MGTRKIKDAKDLTTGEKIYFKGHAKATFLSDGRTVEDAIAGGGTGGSGSGIAIVDDISKLDPNAPLGTLATIVEPSSISEVSVLDLPQPDSSIIDMNTAFVDASSCPTVSSLSITIPGGPIDVTTEITEAEMLYFTSESVDLGAMTTGRVLGIMPYIANNQIVGLVGMYMDVVDRIQKEWVLFMIQDGAVTVDQDDIDECNSYINGLHYISAMTYTMQGKALSTEQLSVYDKVIKLVSGVPSKAYVYQKKDEWEELYKKDFEKLQNNINSLADVLDTKSNIITQELPNYKNELKPNIYYAQGWGATGEIVYKLVTPEDNTRYNEYMLQLRVNTTPTGASFKDENGAVLDIKWANDVEPVFEAGFTYIISIVNNFGVFSQFVNS